MGWYYFFVKRSSSKGILLLQHVPDTGVEYTGKRLTFWNNMLTFLSRKGHDWFHSDINLLNRMFARKQITVFPQISYF